MPEMYKCNKYSLTCWSRFLTHALGVAFIAIADSRLVSITLSFIVFQFGLEIAFSDTNFLFCMQYKPDDPVTLWVNKVGPYYNPQETYNYYSLPFCRPSENAPHRWGGLGEVLGGNELIDSQINIKFQSMPFTYTCTLVAIVFTSMITCIFLFL